MSALLAALKKAAEEKNRRQKQAPEPSTSSQLDIKPTDEVLQMDFAEGIEASQPSVDQLSDQSDSSSESVYLNFVDESLNDQVDSPSNQPQEEASSALETDLIPEPEPEPDSASNIELATESVGAEVESDLFSIEAEALASETPFALDQGQAFVLEASENTEDHVIKDESTALNRADERTNSTTFKMVEEVADDSSGGHQRMDLETSLALNDESDSLSSSTETPHVSPQRKSSDEAKLQDNVDVEVPQEDDWSLEKIPGYQQNELPPNQRNMQRFIQAIQPKGGLKSHLSIKHWMWVPLILISLGYFGLVVYERESARMADNLKPFQMQGTVPATNPSVTQQATSVVAPEKVSQPELEKKDTILGEATSSPLDVSAVSPKQSEQPPKQTEQQAPLTPKVKEKRPSQPAQSTQLKTSGDKTESTMASATQPNYKIEMVKPNKAVFDGYDAYQQGDFAAAERFYQQAYASDPENLPALFGLAATAAKKGESQKSLQLYQQILAKMPDNQEAIVAAAMLETTLQEGPEVQAKLEQLVRKIPKNAQLQMALGHQYAKKMDWVSAQKYYFRAYELDSTNPAHARNLAISLDQLGQYALAKRYYEQTLALSDLSKADQRQLKKRLMVINQHLLEESVP